MYYNSQADGPVLIAYANLLPDMVGAVLVRKPVSASVCFPRAACSAMKTRTMKQSLGTHEQSVRESDLRFSTGIRETTLLSREQGSRNCSPPTYLALFTLMLAKGFLILRNVVFADSGTSNYG